MKLSDHEVQPVAFEELVPAVTAQVPPSRRKFGRAGSIQRNKRRTEFGRPDFENTLDAIASKPGRKQRWLWQAAPVRLRRISELLAAGLVDDALRRQTAGWLTGPDEVVARHGAAT